MRSTALQEAQQALLDVLADARQELDERAYGVFVDFLCLVVAREASRGRWRDPDGEEGSAA